MTSTDPTLRPPPTNTGDTTEARLAELERTVHALAAEVAALRAQLGIGRDTRARASAWRNPPRDAERAERAERSDRKQVDFEGLLGRYGMLIIAALAAAGAVGTFLSWAIGHGYLTFSPAARVVVGLLVAAGIGAWGLNLRRRERSFGSSILGLALAIALVCAYASGPAFHLVPLPVAFVGAAAISWALALFALHEQDEPLWCIGVAGAALAPFVTSGGTGNVFALLAYGVIVTLPAALAISQRTWPVGWRLFYAVTALYAVTGAAIGADRGRLGVAAALAFPLVIAVGAVVPFAPDERKRGAARWLVSLCVVGAALVRVSLVDDVAAMATITTVAALAALALTDSISSVPQSTVIRSWRAQPMLLDWLDAAVLPSLLLYVYAGAALPTTQHMSLAGAGLAAFSIYSWRRPVGALRDAAAAAATLAAFAALEAAAPPPTTYAIAIAATGLLALAMHVARPSRGWLAGGAVLIVFAAASTVDALTSRLAYRFTPFDTGPSLAAAAVTLACIAVARFRPALIDAARRSINDATPRDGMTPFAATSRAFAAAPWLWAFIWVLIELAMAYSPSTSTLLLVVYFAAAGVGCVGVGRARQFSLLRKIGLGLALVAAATAIYGASTYFDFAARISAYLVTSVFLLGIAYWYRRPGAGVGEAAAGHVAEKGGVGEPAEVK